VKTTDRVFSFSFRKILESEIQLIVSVLFCRNMERKSRTLLILCLAYAIWHTAGQWTNTLLTFLHWGTAPPMNVLQISYVQAFGSCCNAIGALILGQVFNNKMTYVLYNFRSSTQLAVRPCLLCPQFSQVSTMHAYLILEPFTPFYWCKSFELAIISTQVLKCI
jgi:hypothetical protein